MLKNIDPIITPDLLTVLASMGHGDDLVICDTNFPSRSVAQHTMVKAPIELPNVSAARAVRAILSLMPLDSFVDYPARRMQVVGQPDEIPEVQREVQAEIDRGRGPVLADGVGRALRLLRGRQEGLCRGPGRGGAVLRLLPAEDGRDPAEVGRDP